jgi:hypothetical protein
MLGKAANDLSAEQLKMGGDYCTYSLIIGVKVLTSQSILTSCKQQTNFVWGFPKVQTIARKLGI